MKSIGPWKKGNGRKPSIWRAASQKQPGNTQAALWLSQLLETDNQVDAAGETLRKALQAAPQDADLQYRLLAFYVRNGKTDLAKADLSQLEKNTGSAAGGAHAIIGPRL